MTAYQLAEVVERYLTAQRRAGSAKSFGPVKEAAAEEARRTELELKKVCDAILRPVQEQPDLFENPKPTAH